MVGEIVPNEEAGHFVNRGGIWIGIQELQTRRVVVIGKGDLG